MTTCKAIAFALAVAGVFLPSPSRAQNSDDQAGARSLFDEGRRLLQAGQSNEACPKFEAAARMYASAGILLNLGDCYEKIGRTASAWSQFGASASAASRAGRTDQETEAKRRQAALEPKLSRMVVVVSHEVPGLVVSRDGTDLAPAAWGSAIPVDPGSHSIRARADGREAWQKSVTVTGPGKTVTLEVPELERAAAPVATPPAQPSETAPPPSLPATPDMSTSSGSHLPVAGIVLVAAGAAVGIGGGVLMAIESSKASTARKNDTSAANSSTSVDDFNATRTPWAIGLGGAIAGGVAAAVGVTLIVTSHGSAPRTGVLRASPVMTAGGGGLQLAGAW